MVLDLPADGSSSTITIACVEKAYLLLSLKHSPEKASLFLDAWHGYGGARDMQAAKEEAEASAARLSKLIHKAYTKLLSSIREREREEELSSIADPLFRRARSLHEAGGYGGGGGGRRIMAMEL
jgi:orotidine-5'-phosphate decarboxylase